MTSPMRVVARKLDLTEGQAYTAAIGLVVGLAAAIGGIPPTLVERLAPTASRPAAPVGEVAPAASTPPASEPAAVDDFAVPVDPTVAPGFVADPILGGGDSDVDDGQEQPPPGHPAGTVDVFASVPAPGVPEGIAVGADGVVFVSSSGRVLRYSPTGAVEATVPVAGARALAMPRASSGVVYAVAGDKVVRVEGATPSTYATVPDVAPCAASRFGSPCELSPVDSPPDLRGAAFASDGALYVTDRGQAVVWRVAPGGREVALAAQDVAFVSPDGLAGVGFDSQERVVVAVTTSLPDAGAGAVYRLGESLEKVAAVDGAAGVAGGRSGRLYVTSSTTGRLVVLEADGAVRASYPGRADAPWDTPVGVAFRGTDALVVEQAPTRPVAGRVVRVVLDDRGVL